MSRVYADVNKTLGRDWFDYENFKIEWSPPDRYCIVARLGGGKYSEVFQAVDMVNTDTCVIKVLKPVPAKKIKREIMVLRNITGGPNIIGLLDVVRDPSGRYHSLIMEHVENSEWKRLYPILTLADIKLYLFQLLKALDFVHSRGIMHRDVKPGNVMINHQTHQLRLIDWGLAEFYHPGTEYHIRVGSRYYKPIELLVGYRKYDYSLDMWALGCMMAAMLFRKEHFFRGTDNDDQLYKIIRILGTEDFDEYLQKYAIPFETDHEVLLRNYPKQNWQRFVTSTNQELVSAEGLDLLDKMLKYDHQQRLTAQEAQAHVFFNSVRLEATVPKAECLSDSGFCSA